ncbi:phosphonatase-like hydrolase [Ferruginibacter sp.]
MIKMVVFDMAGTTVDEDNIVYKTLHKVINGAGFAVSFEQVLADGAGKEKLTAIKDIIKTTGKDADETTTAALYDHFLQELAFAYHDFELKPQDGAAEVFEELRKRSVQVVLNTGYNRETAVGILERLNWQEGKEFDELITAADVTNNRPHPDMILLAMQRSGITDAKEVAKVGDSIIDIEEGKNAGCGLSIGITTGAHTYKQLASAQPNNIIHHLQELLALI